MTEPAREIYDPITLVQPDTFDCDRCGRHTADVARVEYDRDGQEQGVEFLCGICRQIANYTAELLDPNTSELRRGICQVTLDVLHDTLLKAPGVSERLAVTAATDPRVGAS